MGDDAYGSGVESMTGINEQSYIVGRQAGARSSGRAGDAEFPSSGLGRGNLRPSRSIGIVLFVLPTLAAFGPFIPGLGPIFAFRLAAAILLVLALFARNGSASSYMRAPTISLVVAWALVAVSGLLGSDLSPQASSELLSLIAGLGLLLAVVLLRSPRQLLVILSKGWLLSYAVVSMFAVGEILTDFSLGTSFAPGSALSEWGVTVSFFNPNNYATYLLYSFFVLGFLCFQPVRKIVKLAAALSLASIPFFMLESNSRTGFWVLSVATLVCIFLALRGRPLLRTIFLVSTLVGLLTILGFTESNPIDEVVQYIGAAGYSISVLGLEIPVDQSTYVRWQLVGAGVALTGTSPLFGGGAGSFESYVSGMGFSDQTFGILSPHNGFVEVLSQYGLMVASLFIVWFTQMLRSGLRNRNVASPMPSFAWMALSLGILSLPIVYTMHSSMIEPSTTWAFLGFLLLLSRSREPADFDGSAVAGHRL